MKAPNPYVVIVGFSLKSAASRAEGKKLLVQNAKKSLQSEIGCHRFDVVETNDAKVPFVLYEIYQDEAAFSEHLKSSHYLEFDAAADQYFDDKKIQLGSLVNEATSLMDELENE